MLRIIEECLKDFVAFTINEKIEIYNEFSLQHELGAYLRERLKGTGFNIQFERNTTFFGIDKTKLIKKEIDLSIFNSGMKEKYAIELKFPMNGQYPETMYSLIKDICFCEQLTQSGFDGAFAFTIVSDKLFYDGATKNGIYSYFRDSKPVAGTVRKPTGTLVEEIKLSRTYSINWNVMEKTSRFYIVAVQSESDK